MKIKRKKTVAIISAMLCAVLLLCACKGPAAPPIEYRPGTELPGEPTEGGSFMAKMFFLSGDGTMLLPEEREIPFSYGASRVQAAVAALIQGPESLALNDSVPSDMTLQRVEVSDGVCNVYLLSSYMPDAHEWMIARTAIAATAAACENTGMVNVLLNGVEPGYNGRPLGAASPVTEGLNAYVQAVQQTAETGDADVVYGPSYATLYYADGSGKLLMAKNRQMSFSASGTPQSMAVALINSILVGDDTLLNVAPEGMGIHSLPTFTPIMAASSEEDDTPHPTGNVGDRPQDAEASSIGVEEPQILKLELEEPAAEYDRELLCGALTLTLTGYIPGIQGVDIAFHTASGAIERATDAEYFTRDDFTGLIGRSVYFASPDQEGMLMRRVAEAVSSANSYDPRMRLEMLLEQENLPITAGDVKDVYIANGVVVVDWKAGFAQKLAEYTKDDETLERMFVYTIVNTLTEMQGVSGVWMLENGQKLGVMSEIYLGNALMRNPGMIV